MTLIPPPKTPEREGDIDFSFMAANEPPPGFSDMSNAMVEEEGKGNNDNKEEVEEEESCDLSDIPISVIDLPSPLEMTSEAGQGQQDEEFGLQMAALDALTLG